MTHTSTQQPEVLNLEEFRTKVTHAAREPLLARIAELEEKISASHDTWHRLEQFIEKTGDVHFRCRVGSKEGAIRWDIEFGYYGLEVRGKTLREAITKAISAQAKQGDQP